MKSVFSKINLNNNKTARIYISDVKDTNSLELTILHNTKAWKTTVTETDLKNFAEKQQESLENYRNNLLNLIKTPNPQNIFSISDNELIINQQISNSSLKIRFFQQKLTEVNYSECTEELLDEFYANYNSAHQKFTKTLTNETEIENFKQKYENKLEELIKQKIQDEDELYGQFVLILNEKKRKIQHLTELLNASQNKQLTKPRLSQNTKKETVSESESSENDVNTDEETNKDIDEPQPGPSNRVHSILDDPVPTQRKIRRIMDELDEIPIRTSEILHNTPKLIPQQEKNVVIKDKSPEKEIKITPIEVNTQDLLDSY